MMLPSLPVQLYLSVAKRIFMKILHIIPSLRKGGAERLCLDIVRAQNAVPGMESIVATLHPANEYHTEYPDISPRVLNSQVVPSISGKWKIDTREWDLLLHDYKPDIIHSHLFEAELLSRYIIRPGIKYVSHCHDNMHQMKKLSLGDLMNKKRITEAYERHFILKRYKACNNTFVAISADVLQYFKEQLPPKLAARVFLLHNAIDVSRFSRKTALFPETESIQLINIGSFVPKKNQALLVDVVEEMNRLDISCTLVLVGDGPLLPTVQLLAQKKGLDEQIQFLGKISHVEKHLWDSQIYVHTATYEPFGLVLVEAMAAGLPVVALNGKGNQGLIKEGNEGFMVDRPNPRLMAEKIAYCIQSKTHWQSMSKCARNTAMQYDIVQYVSRLLSVYKGQK